MSTPARSGAARASRRVRARHLWTPDGLRDDMWVSVDSSGVIDEVRPARSGDGVVFDGVVLPGLLNAHAHLELSDLSGAVPPSQDFSGWVGSLFAATRGDVDRAGRRSAEAMYDLGTAWVMDVTNGGVSAAWIADAGMSGVLQHEVLGFDQTDVPAIVASLNGLVRRESGLAIRPSPHALFSTAPQLVVHAVRAVDSPPATIHMSEARAERVFLERGEGPFAALLDRLGRRWRWWDPPGISAAAYLDRLGVLGPGLMMVHGIWMDESDAALAARASAPLCLCPRSNLHVEGRLPDVPMLWRSGVRFALGTDSLASTPDLDLLAEMATLAREFPDVPLEVWVAAATHGGAEIVGTRDKGRVVVGASPGLLGVPGAHSLADLCRGQTMERNWLVAPGGPT